MSKHAPPRDRTHDKEGSLACTYRRHHAESNTENTTTTTFRKFPIQPPCPEATPASTQHVRMHMALPSSTVWRYLSSAECRRGLSAGGARTRAALRSARRNAQCTCAGWCGRSAPLASRHTAAAPEITSGTRESHHSTRFWYTQCADTWYVCPSRPPLNSHARLCAL